jgi:uncharacterized protein (DUF58 family)/transglutaminase-like putative cysteine protease
VGREGPEATAPGRGEAGAGGSAAMPVADPGAGANTAPPVRGRGGGSARPRPRNLREGLRLAWRMLRQQHITRDGWFYVGFALVVGLAAINTGNNLLYLVLGLQLSLLVLSAVLSEVALRGVEVERTLPRDAVAGEPFAIGLAAVNRKRRFPSFSLSLTELEGPAAGVRTFLPRVGAGETARARITATVPRRGELRFGAVLVATRFPFGLFEKSREHLLPALLPVHPAAVPAPAVRTRPRPGGGERPEPRPGRGAEFHSLRDFRSGDDPRSVHWRSSARVGRLLVVERERERRRRVLLVVDTRGRATAEELDGAAEGAAALARRHVGLGHEVGLAWAGGGVATGSGPAHLRRLLDATAVLGPAAPGAPPPAAPGGVEVLEVPLGPAAPARPGAKPAFAGSTGHPAGLGKLTLRDVQRYAVLVASLGAFASLAISGELPTWILLTFPVAALFGLFLGERSHRLVRFAANLVVIATLAALAVLVFRGTLDVFIGAPTFAVVLAASRLVGRSGPDDDPLLLLASLLMLAGGAALTGDLAYGVSFAVFAVAGTVALCLTHLRREVETVEGVPASRRPGTVSPALLLALALLSIASLGGSALVFVGFPRLSTGLFQRAPVPQVGAPDRIRLGGEGFLKDDPFPVMRVRFDREPKGEVYWRTGVFEEWTGAEWRRVARGVAPLPLAANTYRLGYPGEGAREWMAEVELLEPEGSIPVPGRPLAVTFLRRPGQAPPALGLRTDGSLELRGAGDEVRYRIAAVDAGAPVRMVAGRDPGPVDAAGYPAEAREALGVPADVDPRVRELAATFARAGGPRDIAAAVERHLSTFRYTRQLPGDTAGDPLARFLFETRAGHCEFFAGAMAALLRLNGIPARVVAGYYGTSPVEGADYRLVRRGDAHAWTEVYLPGEGWTRFDATPAADRPGDSSGPWARLIEAVDVLRARWARWVIDYSGQDQVRAVSAVLAALGGVGRGSDALGGLARWLVAGLALAGAVILAPRLRRRLRPPGTVPGARERAAIAYYRAVKRELVRRGISLPPSATAEEWAAAAGRRDPALGRATRVALEAYGRARFGGRRLPRSVARRHLREVRDAGRGT